MKALTFLLLAFLAFSASSCVFTSRLSYIQVLDSWGVPKVAAETEEEQLITDYIVDTLQKIRNPKIRFINLPTITDFTDSSLNRLKSIKIRYLIFLYDYNFNTSESRQGYNTFVTSGRSMTLKIYDTKKGEFIHEGVYRGESEPVVLRDKRPMSELSIDIFAPRANSKGGDLSQAIQSIADQMGGTFEQILASRWTIGSPK